MVTVTTGSDLNVTGSGINPHNNNDISDFSEQFGDIIQVSNWGMLFTHCINTLY